MGAEESFKIATMGIENIRKIKKKLVLIINVPLFIGEG